MDHHSNAPRPPALPSAIPHIRLFGDVCLAMLGEFFRQQAACPAQGPIVFELSTSGGDADVGRRIGQELRLWRDLDGREVWFLGKSYVFSAGVTIMAEVDPSKRFLTRDTQLLIHERKIRKDLQVDGSLRAAMTVASDLLAEIEAGQRLEREGFEALARGSKLSLADIQARVMVRDWYLSAPEAMELGLVAGLV